MIFFLKQSHKNDLPSVGAHCWCSGIMQDSHSCDPGSIPGQCTMFFSCFFFIVIDVKKNNFHERIMVNCTFNVSGMGITLARSTSERPVSSVGRASDF